MPGGDRTGPMGMGMRTGRGAGYCGGVDRPGYATAGGGFRCGRGAWRGRGFGGTGAGRGYAMWVNRPWGNPDPQSMPHRFPAETYERPDPEMEKRMLARQAEDLQAQLDAIRKRLAEIGTAPSSS